MCFSVNVTTFKAYVTAVMNKLTYVLFHKVGQEQLSGEVGNFASILLQIYFSICVPKVIEILCGLTKLLIAKLKRVQFFCPTVQNCPFTKKNIWHTYYYKSDYMQ